MTNKTQMNDLKYALYRIKNVISAEDCRDSLLLNEIQKNIEYLLDDEKMMHSRNDFDFSERTNLMIIKLYANLFEACFYHEITHKKQLNHIFASLHATSFDTRAKPIHTVPFTNK